MDLRMRRIVSDGETTLGMLETPAGRMATCEDEYRVVKILGQTRIPAGAYNIQLRTDSLMASRYRERFGPNHHGIPWLQDVENFTWVYIHVGNDEEDTDGCILVGEAANFMGMVVQNSVRAYTKIQRAIQEALEAGEAVTITITDEDQ